GVGFVVVVAVGGTFRFAEKSEKGTSGDGGDFFPLPRCFRLVLGTGVGGGNRVDVFPGGGIRRCPRFRVRLGGTRGRCFRRPGADLGDAGDFQRGIGEGDTFANAEVFATGAAERGVNEGGFLLKMSAGGTGQV